MEWGEFRTIERDGLGWMGPFAGLIIRNGGGRLRPTERTIEWEGKKSALWPLPRLLKTVKTTACIFMSCELCSTYAETTMLSVH